MIPIEFMKSCMTNKLCCLHAYAGDVGDADFHVEVAEVAALVAGDHVHPAVLVRVEGLLGEEAPRLDFLLLGRT
jgi:hypothetical protein